MFQTTNQIYYNFRVIPLFHLCWGSALNQKSIRWLRLPRHFSSEHLSNYFQPPISPAQLRTQPSSKKESKIAFKAWKKIELEVGGPWGPKYWKMSIWFGSVLFLFFLWSSRCDLQAKAILPQEPTATADTVDGPEKSDVHHQFGMVPIHNLRCLLPINWCKISLAHLLWCMVCIPHFLNARYVSRKNRCRNGPMGFLRSGKCGHMWSEDRNFSDIFPGTLERPLGKCCIHQLLGSTGGFRPAMGVFSMAHGWCGAWKIAFSKTDDFHGIPWDTLIFQETVINIAN